MKRLTYLLVIGVFAALASCNIMGGTDAPICASELDLSADSHARYWLYWLKDNCYVPETMVMTSAGPKAIKDFSETEILPGAFGDRQFRVYGISKDRYDGDLVVLDGAFRVTPIHPIAVMRDGRVTVVQAKDVTPATLVYTSSGLRHCTVTREHYAGYVYNVVLYKDAELAGRRLTARLYFADGIATADLSVQRALNQ